MADQKAKLHVHPILKSTSPLFYLSRIAGILPFSLIDFRKYHELKTSIPGTLWCLISITVHCMQYQIAMNNSLKDQWGGDTNTLTSVIGLFIVSMEPFMMAIAVLSNIFYQKRFIECIERLAKVDERLHIITAKSVDGGRVKRLTYILILATCVLEIGLVLFNFLQFQISDDILYQTYWWIASGIPIYFDAIARLWYLVMIYLVKLRIEAVNEYCYELQTTFKAKKDKFEIVNAIHQDSNVPTVSIGYLGKEIKDPMKRNNKKVLFAKTNKIHSGMGRESARIFVTSKGENLKGDTFIVNDTMDKKLIELARLHDELCEVAKLINKIFSFQILITMAYGFMGVTAQLYFLYCGLVGQEIPVLFRSAESITISSIYICYTAAKCVSVILVSWKTKIEAQKTGIFLHKIGNIVDEQHFYHVTNHLSLKLLNNQLSLTACGFFELDMTTIYAVSW